MSSFHQKIERPSRAPGQKHFSPAMNVSCLFFQLHDYLNCMVKNVQFSQVAFVCVWNMLGAHFPEFFERTVDVPDADPVIRIVEHHNSEFIPFTSVIRVSSLLFFILV